LRVGSQVLGKDASVLPWSGPSWVSRDRWVSGYVKSVEVDAAWVLIEMERAEVGHYSNGFYSHRACHLDSVIMIGFQTHNADR
jgi:hypothetical protein